MQYRRVLLSALKWLLRKWEVLLALAGVAWGIWILTDLLKDVWVFTTDDAYISLRYAKNLVAGHGITWNPGGLKVEGYSNFLSVILGAAFMVVGTDPVLGLKIVGVASLLGSLLLASWLAGRWSRPLMAPIPVFIAVAHPGLSMWSVSGMETSLYMFLMILAVALMDLLSQREWNSRYLSVLLAVVSFLAGISRAEGGIVFGAIFIVWLCTLAVNHIRSAPCTPPPPQPWSPENRKILLSFAWFVGMFGVLYGTYFLWRFSYYGKLLPNSVYCKMSDGSHDWKIVKDFWSGYSLVVIWAIANPLLKGSRKGLAAVILLFFGYVYVLKGADPILAYHDRYFLPVFVPLLAAAAAGMWRVSSMALSGLPNVIASLLVVVLAIGSFGFISEDDRQKLVTWSNLYSKRMEAREETGRYLDSTLGQDDWAVVGDAGMIPYEADVNVIDAFCLNCPEFVGPEIDKSYKRFVDWILDQKPQAIVVHSNRKNELKPRSEYGFYPDLVSREEFKRLYKCKKVFGAKRDSFHFWVFELMSSK